MAENDDQNQPKSAQNKPEEGSEAEKRFSLGAIWCFLWLFAHFFAILVGNSIDFGLDARSLTHIAVILPYFAVFLLLLSLILPIFGAFNEQDDGPLALVFSVFFAPSVLIIIQFITGIFTSIGISTLILLFLAGIFCAFVQKKPKNWPPAAIIVAIPVILVNFYLFGTLWEPLNTRIRFNNYSTAMLRTPGATIRPLSAPKSDLIGRRWRDANAARSLGGSFDEAFLILALANTEFIERLQDRTEIESYLARWSENVCSEAISNPHKTQAFTPIDYVVLACHSGNGLSHKSDSLQSLMNRAIELEATETQSPEQSSLAKLVNLESGDRFNRVVLDLKESVLVGLALNKVAQNTQSVNCLSAAESYVISVLRTTRTSSGFYSSGEVQPRWLELPQSRARPELQTVKLRDQALLCLLLTDLLRCNAEFGVKSSPEVTQAAIKLMSALMDYFNKETELWPDQIENPTSLSGEARTLAGTDLVATALIWASLLQGMKSGLFPNENLAAAKKSADNCLSKLFNCSAGHFVCSTRQSQSWLDRELGLKPKIGPDYPLCVASALTLRLALNRLR